MAERRVVLVTGASSGIGAAIADAFDVARYRVFGTTRATPAHLTDRFEGVTLDVDDDESVRAGIATVLTAAGRIDVLVNNAGYLCAGAVEEIPVGEAKAQFETNYFGVLRTTAAVLPGMRAAGRGHVITVSSVAARVPPPFWGHYSASKAAVAALMETLRYEVRPFGIRVATVEPGVIRTPFFARTQPPGIADYAGPRHRAYEVMAGQELAAPGPEVVARRVVALAGQADPPLRTVVTREAKRLVRLRSVLPAATFEALLRNGFRLTDRPR